MKKCALIKTANNILHPIPKYLTLGTLNNHLEGNSTTFFQLKALSDKDPNAFCKVVNQLDQNIRTYKETPNINYSFDIENLIINQSFTSDEMSYVVRDIFSGCSNLIEFRNKLGTKIENLISLEYIITKLPEHHNILNTFSDLIKCTPGGIRKFTKELEANVESPDVTTPGYDITNFCNKTIVEEENKYKIFSKAAANISASLPEDINTIEGWTTYFRQENADVVSKLLVLPLLPSSKFAQVIAPICLELASLDENTDAGEFYEIIESVIKEKNFTKIEIEMILSNIAFECSNLYQLKEFLQDNPEKLMILQNVMEHNDIFQVDLSSFIREVSTTYRLLEEMTKRLYSENIEDDCRDIIVPSSDDEDSIMSDSSSAQEELEDFTIHPNETPTQYIIVRPSAQEQHRQLYANLQQKINKLDYYIRNESNSLYPPTSDMLARLTQGAFEASIGALDTDYPMDRKHEITHNVKLFLSMMVPSVIGDNSDSDDDPMSDN